MDVTINLPANSALESVAILVCLGIASAAFVAWPVTVLVKYRRLVRKGDWSNMSFCNFEAAMRRKLKRRAAPLVVVGLLGILACIRGILTHRFHAVHVQQDGFLLDYAFKYDALVKWEQIEKVELEKEHPKARWYIAIQTVNGPTYRSQSTSTYKENDEMHEAFEAVRKIWEQKH